MPTIYANDFAGITAGENAAAAQRNAALQASMQNFQAGMAAARARQQHDQEIALRKSMNEVQQRQFDSEMELKKSAEERRAREEGDRTRISQGYLDIAKSSPTPQAERDRALHISLASQDAASGAYATPEEFLSRYPKLSPEEASAMTDRSLQSRRQIESDYQTATNAADLLNRNELVKRYIPLSQEAISDTPWYRRGMGSKILAGVTQGVINPDTSDYEMNQQHLKDYQAEAGELAPKATRILQDKRINQLVTFDPGQDRYVPTIPAPQWTTGTGSTGGNLARAYVPAPQVQQQQQQQPQGGRPFGPPVPIQDEPPAGMIQAPRTSAQPAGAGKFEPYFYQRVNELISSGLPPADAKARALQERQVGYP
jgi:hypothetical protein